MNKKMITSQLRHQEEKGFESFANVAKLSSRCEHTIAAYAKDVLSRWTIIGEFVAQFTTLLFFSVIVYQFSSAIFSALCKFFNAHCVRSQCWFAFVRSANQH
jgi:hypothetical protein